MIFSFNYFYMCIIFMLFLYSSVFRQAAATKTIKAKKQNNKSQQ